MIEMTKLKKLGLIKFLNAEKWDYDYTTIDGIDYFNWEGEEPIKEIETLIDDLTFVYDVLPIINGDSLEEIKKEILWLKSIPEKYHNL